MSVFYIQSTEQELTSEMISQPVSMDSSATCHQTRAQSSSGCYYKFMNIFTSASSRCPLPPLKWAKPQVNVARFSR